MAFAEAVYTGTTQVEEIAARRYTVDEACTLRRSRMRCAGPSPWWWTRRPPW
ncbi:MAG: hypothetical protein R3A10_00985 [Caldilineaceae bacterium]